MKTVIDFEYKIKWPAELVEEAKSYGGFARGTPEVGSRIIKRVAALIVRGIKDNIKLSRGVRGGKLTPLDRDTIRKKQNKGYPYPMKPLRAKGILYRSIHYFKTGPAAGQISIKAIGKPSRLDIAEWQQTGEYGGPKRVFFGISKQTRTNVNALIKREFLSMMRRSKTIAQGKARGGKAFKALDI